MKKLAIFGGSGGLGSKLQKLFSPDKYEVIALSSKDVDITDFKSVDDFCSLHQPDIVINMAGYNFDSFIHKIDKSNIEEIQKVVNVNIIGSLNVASCALRQMRVQGYGRLIFISSVLSKKVMMGTAAYSSSKAFIDNLVKTASSENAIKGITCNSIQLGYFDGGMCHRMPEKVQEAVKSMIPLKRWGKIEELHSTIEYLIDTEYVTGQNIEVSGGIL